MPFKYAGSLGFLVLSVIFFGVGLATQTPAAFFASAALSLCAFVVFKKLTERAGYAIDLREAPAFGGKRVVESMFDPEVVEKPYLEIAGMEHFDDLTTAELLPALETLSVDDLKKVIAAEKMGLQRPFIIERSQFLIDLIESDMLGKTPPSNEPVRRLPGVEEARNRSRTNGRPGLSI